MLLKGVAEPSQHLSFMMTEGCLSCIHAWIQDLMVGTGGLQTYKDSRRLLGTSTARRPVQPTLGLVRSTQQSERPPSKRELRRMIGVMHPFKTGPPGHFPLMVSQRSV